ncbi:MAG: VWA domain-containing protein [Pyrinomonadaceae bacterium]
MAENADKPTFADLARRLGRLPADKKRAALETSAALAGVSLRVSREFVEAVPSAARILSADDLRAWGELGRRLSMGSAETGANYFAAGAGGLKKVPRAARAAAFQICTRQLVLSSSTALETFHTIPGIAAVVADSKVLTALLNLGVDIAERSAKHSADFIKAIPEVEAAFARFGDDRSKVTDAALALASKFAERTGGMTADLWSSLPVSLDKIDAGNATRLMESSADFLEYGGSVAQNFLSAGADVLAASPAAFADWQHVAVAFAQHGNAVLISFLRATPRFFTSLTKSKRATVPDISRVLHLVARITESDAEGGLAAFKSSVEALRTVSIEQYEAWIESGLKTQANEGAKARRSYFALETRASKDLLHEMPRGVSLESVQPILRIYIEALTGNEVEIAPLPSFADGSRIGDGKTIHLPSSIAELGDDDSDFRLYKVLAAHGAGQIEFGTFERGTPQLRAAFSELHQFYSATEDERDAFSLGGYIDTVSQSERSLPPAEPAVQAELSGEADYRAVLGVFPEPHLARKIFGTMENARIDYCLRQSYRGLRRDLDLLRLHLRQSRPYIFDLPMYQVPSELLFQITMCGGATDDARSFYGQVVSEIESVIETFVISRGDILPTVADSLMATSRLYSMFQNIGNQESPEADSETPEKKSEFAYDDKNSLEAVTEDKVKREKRKPDHDLRDLFNAWNSLDDEGEPDDLSGSEAWSESEMPEQALDADDVAFAYDEWDRELNDYRVGWSRVIEKKVKRGDRNFVEIARSRYRGVISSIRHQFQLMKPENLARINREIDGEDYDLNALVDFVIDRRTEGRPSENIYTKKLRKQRDVAVSILLDQSSSTARTITRNPLQPYTHPGRRIIEIEKEGLVLMSEALEAVGDVYSIYGFTSEGRRNVKFYVIKDFAEKYSADIEQRIGGITFQNNTRLGAAIRHAAHKLMRQEARTKLLIILTDGRPYDHDYGDARYAREDVREALIEAKSQGLTPFCITVDRESESELKDLYGDVGYTIIDDVLSLPERMPAIYRRLTS